MMITIISRNFAPVDDAKKDIIDFIQVLAKNIPIGYIKGHKSFFEVYTDRVFLFLYIPGTRRADEGKRPAVIHIDYDQIRSVPQKIINRLKGQHGGGRRIYARTTVVARVDKRVSMEFQEEHHLQVALPGKYRYGLFYQGELVSIAIFSGGRIMRQLASDYRSFELIRFCHKSDTLIIGGISKLLKAFIKEFSPQDIMTYADRDWVHGDSSLETIGFNTVEILAPQRFAIVAGQRLTDIADEQKVDYYVENKGSLKLKLIL